MLRFFFLFAFLISYFSVNARELQLVEKVESCADLLAKEYGEQYDSMLVYTQNGSHYLMLSNKHEHKRDAVIGLKMYDAVLNQINVLTVQELANEECSIHFDKKIFSAFDSVKVNRKTPNPVLVWNAVSFIEHGKVKFTYWILNSLLNAEDPEIFKFCDYSSKLLKEIEER